MKVVALALTAVVALSGAAMASGPAAGHGKNEPVPNTENIVKIEVPAGSVYSGRQLNRAGLSADSVVSVTKFPSNGVVNER